MAPLPDLFEKAAQEIVDKFGAFQNGTYLSYTHASELTKLIVSVLKAAVAEEREKCAEIARSEAYKHAFDTPCEFSHANKNGREIKCEEIIAAAIRGRKS